MLKNHKKHKSLWWRDFACLVVAAFAFLLIAGVIPLIGSGLAANQAASDVIRGRFSNPDQSVTEYFEFEMALTPDQRRNGLMFVTELPSNKGMLFVFPTEGNQIFWMKNTFISLDMIFLDRTLKVVGVLNNVPPLNELPRHVNKPSKYVVELAAGSARKHRIQVGSILEVASPIPDAG